jgi:inorganic triphosphatase YgiF
MGTNHQEVEWQFDADNLVAVEQWLRARSTVGDVQFHFGTPEEQCDRYYDTADWRFFTAGYALRMRQAGSRGEVTLKSFGTRRDGLRQRHELNQVVNDLGEERNLARALEHLDGEVGGRVRAVLGRAHLTRLFEVRSNRTRVAVQSSGSPIAEIALDEVVIAAGRRRPARLHRVEVEIHDPDGAGEHGLARFVAEMRAQCHLAPAEHSKFEAGVLAYSLQPGMRIDLGQPGAADDAGDDPTIGDLALAVLREHFAQFLLREPGARLGEDPEDVHRMRVATRRLRAAMSLFRDYLPEDAPRLRDELGWVARA